MAYKVLLVDTMHPAFQSILESKGVTVVDGHLLSKDVIAEQIGDFSGLAIRSRFKIDASFIWRCNNLKFIARAGAGMENIDVSAAEAAGIHCLNAPEGNRDAVGEQSIAMLLMLMNNLLRADKEVREGIWKREENRGYELKGKTVGIIGFGNMGSAFAEKLQGFGVKILAYDKYKSIDPLVFPFVKQTEMAELFSECDIISLHVPLTEETTYLVNDSFFDALKKPIWFINTARGKVLETRSLVKALQDGIVRGAALDVLEYEDLSFEHLDPQHLPEAFRYLIHSDKVVLSPHIGGWTFESNAKISTFLAEKALQILENL